MKIKKAFFYPHVGILLLLCLTPFSCREAAVVEPVSEEERPLARWEGTYHHLYQGYLLQARLTERSGGGGGKIYFSYGGEVWEGTWEVEGRHILITDVSCGPYVGTYQWIWIVGGFELALVKDQCGARGIVLPGPWTQQNQAAPPASPPMRVIEQAWEALGL